jgi:hypothetical protein
MGVAHGGGAPAQGDDRVPAGIRFGVIRGVTYGLFRPPDPFVPQARALGAGVVRVYLYWSQIEPEPGRFAWEVVDSLLAGLDGDPDLEVWVTVCSSSPWGTRRATDFLPPSPPRDLAAYAAFVRRLVARCAGRVTYWQCDNEPTVPILWAGTAEEYVAQLEVFAAAVRETDPAALVVLGGAPPGTLIPLDDPEEHAAFRRIVEGARGHFDVFDAHLYGDPYLIPEQIANARRMMADAGYQRPVVAGEYNGPVLFQRPELFAHLTDVLKAMGMGSAGAAPAGERASGEQESGGWVTRVADAGRPAPEHDAMKALYARMATLPPVLQMFMRGCPPELEAARHRWNVRDIVMRNVLALASGVRRTLCWNLAPEIAVDPGPYTFMALMFEKFALMDYRDGEIAHRHPSADALERTTRALRGATGARLLEAGPDRYVAEVAREAAPPLLVAWERRDDLTGEDEPPTPFDLPWPAPAARAIDAHGAPVEARVENGRLRLPLSLTPVFVEPVTADALATLP